MKEKGKNYSDSAAEARKTDLLAHSVGYIQDAMSIAERTAKAKQIMPGSSLLIDKLGNVFDWGVKELTKRVLEIDRQLKNR
jgi:hypothetical protein